MKRTLGEIADAIGASLVGDRAAVVTGVASLKAATPDDIVFVEEPRNLEQAASSAACAMIAGNFAGERAGGKPVLISDQPRLAFARAARLLQTAAFDAGVHPTAVVEGRIGEGVSVGARAVIQMGATIGERTSIGCGAVIGEGVKVGRDCLIYPNVTIYPGTQLHDRVIVHAGAVLGSDGFGYVRDAKTGRYEKFPQCGRLVIEDDVEIGANATVDRGALDETRIRRGAKIDNLVHVGHNASVGQDVVIAAQTGLSGSAVIEDGVIIGGQVGIADHVRIEAGAILGAQSGIPSKKVIRGRGVVFWGTPARPIKEYLKELAVLARLARKG